MNSHEDILGQIRKSAGALSRFRRTEAKAPTIKKILAEVVEGLEKGAQLPSIRSIAKALGTAVVPVHKAMSELKNEGAIVSLSTNGFVKAALSGQKTGRMGRPEPNVPPSMFDPRNSALRFATDSVLGYQREFWRDVVDVEYPKSKPAFTGIEMVFSLFETPEGMAEAKIDMMETEPFRYRRHGLRDVFLSLKSYLAFDSKSGSLSLFDERLVTTHYQTGFLFYNADFLERNRMPEPEYRDFSGQKEYFESVKKEAGALCREPVMGACVHPLLFAGGVFYELMAFLSEGGGDVGKARRLEDSFGKILEFCSLFKYRETPPADKRPINEPFEEGRMPFLAGHSGVHWSLSAQKTPFEWKAYPLFAVDDSCLKLPIYAGALRMTKDPVNALQFLLFLLEDAIQLKLARIGCVPANLGLLKLEHLDDEQNRFFKKCYEQTMPLALADYAQFYVHNAIFAPQFMRETISYGKEKPDFKRLFHFAEAYLASSRDSSLSVGRDAG